MAQVVFTGPTPPAPAQVRPNPLAGLGQLLGGGAELFTAIKGRNDARQLQAALVAPVTPSAPVGGVGEGKTRVDVDVLGAPETPDEPTIRKRLLEFAAGNSEAFERLTKSGQLETILGAALSGTQRPLSAAGGVAADVQAGRLPAEFLQTLLPESFSTPEDGANIGLPGFTIQRNLTTNAVKVVATPKGKQFISTGRGTGVVIDTASGKVVDRLTDLPFGISFDEALSRRSMGFPSGDAQVDQLSQEQATEIGQQQGVFRDPLSNAVAKLALRENNVETGIPQFDELTPEKAKEVKEAIRVVQESFLAQLLGIALNESPEGLNEDTDNILKDLQKRGQ